MGEMGSRGVAALVWLSLLLGTALASAQVVPDVVITTDGGMLRGTIIESVPGDHVTLTLSTGEPRTVLWSNVEYAGPESGRPTNAVLPQAPVQTSVQPPSPGPGYASPRADTVHVQVTAEQDRISLHEVTGTAAATGWHGDHVATFQMFSFNRLCGVPCTLELPRGSHHFALSQGNGGVVPGPQMDILRDGTLSAHYVDRGPLRLGGWLTFLGTSLGGLAWMLTPIFTTDITASDDWLYGLVGGGVLMAVGEIVGLILAFQGDSAEVRFD